MREWGKIREDLIEEGGGWGILAKEAATEASFLRAAAGLLGRMLSGGRAQRARVFCTLSSVLQWHGRFVVCHALTQEWTDDLRLRAGGFRFFSLRKIL